VKVVVVGAGATGLGTAWDLALRGIDVTVLEAREVGTGTSGRFHGLLHSGGRYLVTDPSAASKCLSENLLLRSLLPEGVVATGGYFVKKYGDDDRFESQWLTQAESLGLPIRDVGLPDLRSALPMMAKDVERAYWVPDGVLEGFEVLAALVSALQSHGSLIREHTKAVGLRLEGGRVNGVKVEGPDGSTVLDCDAVVNAAGPWAGFVARDWGLDVAVQPSAGLMLIFANRRVNLVVNRLKPPSDGDIFVPHKSVVILGTTDVAQISPEAPEPTREEARRLMALGAEMIPGLASWRILRAFTGVRPLYEPKGAKADSRTVSRDFAVIDHGKADGLVGAFSVLGGKWTTFRLMGEVLGDELVTAFKINAPCRSAEVVIRPVSTARTSPPANSSGALLCECEQVYEKDLVEPSQSPLKRRFETWFSMGPCQGTFCAHRVLGRDHVESFQCEMANLRRERLHGLSAVTWGTNARLVALARAVSAQSLGEEQ